MGPKLFLNSHFQKTNHIFQTANKEKVGKIWNKYYSKPKESIL
jgi:hypothetical protein